MAGSSNPLPDASIQDLRYLYASNANVSNFVSVKLSGNHNYRLWKTQMLCLMESHDMCGIIVDAAFDDPRDSSIKIRKQYDSLLKGWIFGSISEEVLLNVLDLGSAKDVWEKLDSTYDMSFQQDSALTKQEAKEETKEKEISEETETKDEISTKAKKEEKDLHYALIANVSNFVSVKLSSGNHNYPLWKEQMLCLMTTHNVCGFVNASIARPKDLTPELEKQYDNLVKGWIFGSVSEDVLDTVIHLELAEHVWEKLKSFFVPTMGSDRQAEANTKVEEDTKGEEESIAVVKKELHKATMRGRWWDVEAILEQNKGENLERQEIDSDGNRILHLAVGAGHNDFVYHLLDFINVKSLRGKKEEEDVHELKNGEGNTALHIAAIFGNLVAVRLLLYRHWRLLRTRNHQGLSAHRIACYNMQFDTFVCLCKIDTLWGPYTDEQLQGFLDEGGAEFLVNAISAKQYSTALYFIENFLKLYKYDLKHEDVLVAIARTFPSGLTNWEKLIYPSSLGDIGERIMFRTRKLFLSLYFPCARIISQDRIVVSILFMFLLVPVMMLVSVYRLIRFLILMVYLPFLLLYSLSWKVAATLVAPIKHIEKKKKERKDAKEVLNLVFEEIKKAKKPVNYNISILEAACQNASRVVNEILFRSPEAIKSTNESGHDIIQLAVIHRSEKIYNLYQKGERKRHYRTLEDCFGNNILHLASRLAPSHELNRRTGAALQLQRELQWREEVKKLVLPTFLTKENIFKETPDMVFTREHGSLVKEGEKWMKTTAESCSITAALITTIVFAAAITVPGGSNEGTGIPVFTKDIAFTIFAITDAISLFTSSTSLLAFLSILTARFAEEDFLVRLPRRLIIGLCTLLLSASAMMVAFSATLFLVFCDKKLWMLAPICGLACLPVAFFFIVQFPLIVDLYRSTYGHTFSKPSYGYLRSITLDVARGYFGNLRRGKSKRRSLTSDIYM